MKFHQAALFTAAVGLVAAQPHNHHARHQHHHERRNNPTPVERDVVSVPGPTVVMYELNGKTITETDVKEGIKNGTLVWADGKGPVFSSDLASATSLSASTPVTSTASSPSVYVAPTTSSSSSVESSSSSQAPATTTLAAYTSSAVASSSSVAHVSQASSYSSSSSGVDTPFPDGEIDCSEFPSDYGAVSVDWIGLGGWTGIQKPGSLSKRGGFGNILTVTKSTCGSGGNCCTEGSYCSYACPAGYQKSQWPTTQGETGQSVGGLLCKNGKLHMTNPDLSDTICMKGTDKVNVLVRNEMSQNAAVCRTDYPGTFSC